MENFRGFTRNRSRAGSGRDGRRRGYRLIQSFGYSANVPFCTCDSYADGGAALLLFVTMAVVTAVLLAIGKKRFKTVRVTPDKTIETIKENVD